MHRREWRNPYPEDSPAGKVAAHKRALALQDRAKKLETERRAQASRRRSALSRSSVPSALVDCLTFFFSDCIIDSLQLWSPGNPIRSWRL